MDDPRRKAYDGDAHKHRPSRTPAVYTQRLTTVRTVAEAEQLVGFTPTQLGARPPFYIGVIERGDRAIVIAYRKDDGTFDFVETKAQDAVR